MNQSLPTNFNKLTIELEVGLVRISSDVQLWKYLSGKEHEKITFLVTELKRKYFERFGQALNIPNDSLIVEILVHVYCHQLGLKTLRVVKISFVKKLISKLIDRAKIIDCGEKSRDTNRWFWNLLAYFKPLVLMVFPKNLNVEDLQ